MKRMHDIYCSERYCLSKERCFQFSTQVTIYKPGPVHAISIPLFLILPNVHTQPLFLLRWRIAEVLVVLSQCSLLPSVAC